MQAHLRNIRISPKKVNLLAGLIRKKTPTQAIDFLKFVPKKAARFLIKAIQSALANAENNFKQQAEKLEIQEVIVTGGAMLKRGLPVSRGRYHRIRKRTS